MRLEKKKEEERSRRKGMTGRTLIQIIWLLISFVVAYYLANYLADAKLINITTIYKRLSLPSVIPEEVVLGAIMVLIVIVMQFFLYIGFAFASPEGTRHPGDPTLHSRSKDPFEDRYG